MKLSVAQASSLWVQQASHSQAGRLCCLAFLLLLSAGCHSKRGPVEPFQTTPVTRGDLTAYVTATGTLSAVMSVDVGSQISGTISVINADFNSPVKKGDVVAEIDPATYEASVHQAEADMASAKAARELTRLTRDRKKILVPQHAATQADLDSAEADLAQANATVLMKQATLEKAQADLNYCKITSPVDGIVISREVSLGQTVAATMTTPTIFTIAQDITKMHISATVSEADIGQVKDGQVVDFSVDAFPDEVFKGIVTQVRKSATTTDNVVTYETIIDFDNPEQKLFPGMTADVSILVAQRKGVMKIANAALRFTPPENARYSTPAPKISRAERLIYLPDGPQLKPVAVKAGITDNTDTEVISGLKDGDRVVTASNTVTSTSQGGPFGGGGPPPGGGAGGPPPSGGGSGGGGGGGGGKK